MQYLISDIHGYKKTLEALLNQINICPGDKLYFLGDYIDRGPDSKGVLDIVMDLQESGLAECLSGNHDEMCFRGYRCLEELRTNPQSRTNIYYDTWEINGMQQTIKSFPNGIISDKYIQWLGSRKKILHTNKGIYFVHAGVNTYLDNPMDSDFEYLHWDRECQPTKYKIICGHTPKSLDEIHESLTTNKTFIDGGCHYTHPRYKGRYGNLVALELETNRLIVQPNVG